MKRRELFAALGALLVAPAMAKEVIDMSTAKVDGFRIYTAQTGEISEPLDWDFPLRVYTQDGYEYVYPYTALPIADLANRPADAKRIFEFISSSNFSYQSVQYTGFDQPMIIITGTSEVSGNARVVITESTIRYTVVRRNGQEHTSDVKTEKVVGFIRELGYEFDGQ